MDYIHLNTIMFNDRGLNKEYLETNNVKKMYYNGREVFRRVSFMPTLSVDPAELEFGKTGGTATIGITSNTTWSASTSASWLTITTAATGISVTAPDYSSGETERNTTILVTASNGDFTVSETISVQQSVSTWPEKTFMFNYNAKEYIPSTRTFPKKDGQLFNEDLVLNTAPASYTTDSVYFGFNEAYMGKDFSSSNANPFNRNASLGCNLTFIYKTYDFITAYKNSKWRYLFSNRNIYYNWMILPDRFHTNSATFLEYTVESNPQFVVIRVYSNGNAERKVLDINGNVLQTASSSTITYGGLSNGVGFFSETATGGGKFCDTFYWMYCSLETLTDDEIKSVIDYNENL